MIQKSYDGKPILYLIPTPIGNMDDITYRAVKVLNEVEVIFAEDTRVTMKLLTHLGIKKKLFSSHLHNEYNNKEKLLDYLNKGYNIGLVSDRGTPVISDPGYELVLCAIENGFNVVTLPGATALIPALASSGLKSKHFMFYGFLDNRETKRKKELEELKNIKATIIFYEAPHRIKNTLINIYEIMGNRKICISREISKKFEEYIRGDIRDIINQINELKGEIVVLVGESNETKKYDNLTIIEHVNLYIKEGYKTNDAIKLVAKDRKTAKNNIYNEYHNIK
ncbi:MAG TPA: 16S rRNA (cytidine(1402)-2'-O)-methyltransferase [Tenericutes bacterium]|nr:16S rRNA (cytidine(1402)-2'-O)-methyltransferase [Mycoplasmatota bacterium]